ncbi:hypothetical protein [Neopusillimonas aromaticivorans]|uniref:hypothetical protein n=1 Tax=Neopusillimonas aromaticivorans TaxID=2979868 RepID=UPI003314C3CB
MSDVFKWPVALPECLSVSMDDTIAVLTLNRPHKRNALCDELVLGMQVFFSSIPSNVQGWLFMVPAVTFAQGST